MELPQLIDLLDETIYLCDIETYEMYYINKAGMASIGPGIKLPYVGKPCYYVLQGRDAPCPFCTNHMLTQDEFYVWEHKNELLNKHYLLKDKLVRLPAGRKARMEIAIDITEKQNLNEKIKEKLELETLLVACLRYLSPPNPFSEGIQMVLADIGRFHRADRAYIVEFDYDENIAANTYEWCAEGIESELEHLQGVALSDINTAMDWLHDARVIDIRDVAALEHSDPKLYKVLAPQKIDSLLAVPLCVKDEIVGMLGVDNPRRRHTPELMESLSFFVVSDLKKRIAEAALTRTRQYDSLTGLKNYDSYKNCMAELRAAPPESLGLIVADMNGLKQINHQYGPAYGDTYLIRLSRLLERCLPQAKLFRMAGDEFIAVWEEVPHADFQEAVSLLEHLLENEKDFSVSLGVTWSDQDIDVDVMASYADRLLTLRKQDFCQAGEVVSVNSLLQDDFRDALQEGQFLPFLQPKANIRNGKLTGAEMLVRRFDPVRGIVPPAEFIVRLERTGLIKYLDFYMIESACALLAKWAARGLRPFRLSVNVSRVTLMEPHFVSRLLEIRKKYSFPQGCLELEATERIGKIEQETLVSTAATLRREGFAISLDDFGAEYSSLSLLATLDMDTVKLDKSLIDEIDRNKKSAALAECVINICHRFGMECVAEGVETERQREVLRRMACDDMQGYLLSKPIPVDQFEEKYGSELFTKA